jgi:PAS domain S-box-containing protein
MQKAAHCISLKTKFITVVLVIFVVSSWLLAFAIQHSLKEDMVALLGAQQYSTVSYIAADIDGKIRHRIDLLNQNAKLVSELIGSPEKTREFLKGRIGLQALFQAGLVVIDKQGVGVADYPIVQDRERASFSELEFFQEAIATGKTVIGKPRIGRFTKKPGVAIAAPVRNPAGDITGVIVGFATLSDKSLFGQIEQGRAGKTGWILVSSPRDQLIITSSDPERVLQPLPSPGISKMLDRFIAGYEGSGLTTSQLGIESLVSAKQIPSAGWVIQMALPTAEAFAPIRDMNRHAYELAGGLTLLATLIIWFLVRRALKPLDKTTSDIREMAMGTSDIHSLPLQGDCEIQDLCASFNALVEQRKQAEQSLRESSQSLAEQDLLLRNAQHIAHIGTWRLDHATQRLTWSDEMFNIFEITYSHAPLPAEAWFSAIHPDDRERVRIALANSTGGCNHYDITYRLLLPDGIEKYVHEHCEYQGNDDGQAPMSMGVTQDVTEQVLTEQSIRESEVRFRTIVDYTYDWEYWQGLQGEILYMNTACERVSGYTQTEFICHPTLLDEIVHPNDRHIFAEHHHHSQQETMSSLEFRILTKDGQVRWIWHGCRAVYGKNHQLLGRRASNRDITDRKLVEADLELHRQYLTQMVEEQTADLSIAKEAAEASSRAKTVFLATMSHELRTPINGIMGMAGMALRRATDPKQADQLSKVIKSSENLLAIIGDILDYSKLESERFTLNEMKFAVCELMAILVNSKLQQAKDKGLELIVEIAPGISGLTLSGDEQRISHVLGHLVSNAIKFTASGKITLRAKADVESTEDICMRFEVQDTGIGISEENQKRVFNTFEQVDGSMSRKYGGIGLGLALSKRLIEAMGGSIGVVSTEGAGSTFWFTVRLRKLQPSTSVIT